MVFKKLYWVAHGLAALIFMTSQNGISAAIDKSGSLMAKALKEEITSNVSASMCTRSSEVVGDNIECHAAGAGLGQEKLCMSCRPIYLNFDNHSGRKKTNFTSITNSMREFPSHSLNPPY